MINQLFLQSVIFQVYYFHFSVFELIQKHVHIAIPAEVKTNELSYSIF